MMQLLVFAAIACFADAAPQVNIYTIPASPKFGILERNTSRFDNSKFKNDFTPQEGPMPLRLPVSRQGEEIGFAITIPDSVGPAGELVEIEPPPFVTFFAMSTKSVDLLEKVINKGGANVNKVVVAGMVMQYYISSSAPKNIFLLYLPKNADLKTLQDLYPKEKAFSFEDDKATSILADTALAQTDVASYLDLLHRGGAVIVPGKDGKKIYLAVMPDGELLRHVLQPVARTAGKSGPAGAPKSAPAPTKKAPAKSEPAKPAGQPDERAARSALSAAKAFLGINQTEKAKEYLEKAVQLAPDSEAGKEAKGLLQGLKK